MMALAVFADTYYIENKASMFHLLKDPTGPVGRYMFRVGMYIRSAAQVQVGKRTGALAASISFSQNSTTDGQVLTVGSPLNYAYMHHEGTRPHMIRAKGGGALKFRSGGRVVITDSVVHPGTRPNKYLSDHLGIVSGSSVIAAVRIVV